MRLLIITVLLSALAITASAQDILTNDSVLKMVKSGLGEDLIVGVVRDHPGKYSLTPDDLVRLKQAGVSDKILTAMANKAAGGGTNSAGTVKIELKTPVRLSVDEPISSKTGKSGDAFKLLVEDDVSIEGHLVIARGAPATGRVIAVDKKSYAPPPHNGSLEVAIDSVRAVDGHLVPLDGHLSLGGGGVSFGHKGKEAEIEKGQIVNAVVSAEATITISGTAH